MVREQLTKRGISDPLVLAAMEKVPRHEFVEDSLRDRAYEDNPLPIGEGQTISQPYMIALMAETLKLAESEHVLEVGTGSGYLTAIMAEQGVHVCSVRCLALAIRADCTGKRPTTAYIGDARWAGLKPFDDSSLEPLFPVCRDRAFSLAEAPCRPMGEDPQTLKAFERTKGFREEYLVSAALSNFRVRGWENWSEPKKSCPF
jgi:hypothetical protein